MAMYLPFNDPRRKYTDDHLPVLYGCTYDGHNRVRILDTLDFPQRRWYQITLPETSSIWPVPPLTEKEEEELEKVAREYIASSQGRFNVIKVDGFGNVSFDLQPSIGKAIYNHPTIEDGIIPITSLNAVTEKKYWHDSIDTCVWEGKNCIYKQILFDENVQRMKREINTRETLLQHFRLTDHEELSKHGICPVLAIVVDGDPPLLHGIILPFLGQTLEQLRPTIQNLISLIKTVAELGEAGVMHGDICNRNICVGASSIQLIDFGEIAPDYINDVVATGNFLKLSTDEMNLTEVERQRVCGAAEKLLNGKLKEAQEILEGNMEKMSLEGPGDG